MIGFYATAFFHLKQQRRKIRFRRKLTCKQKGTTYNVGARMIFGQYYSLSKYPYYEQVKDL